MELNGKVCIITGATSGIGRAVAALFAREGAKLIINGRDSVRGSELQKELSRITEAHFYTGDIAIRETNSLLVQKAIEHFGRLDIVVANAGMLGLGRITELDPDVWHDTMDVNVNSVFHLFRSAIPVMQQNGGGSIVINSSIAAFKSFPNHPAYCASKAAVIALGKQVALDYGPIIRVNIVCPGPVDTPLIWDSAVAFKDPDKAVRAAGEKTVLKRLGKPEDVANTILFLASNRSSWMTGSVITVDGGATIS